MATKMSDFIIVPRRVFSEGTFGKPEPFTKREAFLDLVQMAAFDERESTINGVRYKEQRGQLVVSKSFLCKKWCWKVDKVRRYLDYLQRNGWCYYSCDHQSYQPITLLSIANYDAYQGNTTTPTTTNASSDATTATTTGVTQLNKNKNNNKNNNKVGNKKSDDEKERLELAEKLYAIYPTKCPMRGTSTGKSSQDKKKIASLLKDHTFEELESTFKRYVDESLGKAYLKNFSTFLNNLPDYTDSRPSTQGDLFAQTAQQQEAPAKQKTVTLSDLRGWYQEGDPEKKWQEKLPYIIQNYENNGYTIIYDEKQHNPTRGHTTSGN